MSRKNDDEKSLEPCKIRAAARSKIVTIEIGPGHTKYSVHAALIAHHSEYFKKALSSPWKEAEDGLISLKDVDCETFDVFVDWLYTGKLPSEGEDWLPKFAPTIEWKIQLQALWIKLCVFGDRFLASDFQRTIKNYIIDIVAKEGVLFYSRPVNLAFDNLPSDHIILRLLVDANCSMYNPDDDTEENGELQGRDQLSHHFLVQVMLRYAKIVEKSIRNESLNRCDYHEHATKEERKACKKLARKESKVVVESDPESSSDSDTNDGSE